MGILSPAFPTVRVRSRLSALPVAVNDRSVDGQAQSGRSAGILRALSGHQPVGTGGRHFDKAKDDMSRNHATAFIMKPGSDWKLQGSSQQGGAVLAEQLASDFTNTSGQERPLIAHLFHGDHPASTTRRLRPDV